MLHQARMAQIVAEQKEFLDQVRDLSERNPDRMTMLLRRDPDLVERLWARWAEPSSGAGVTAPT